MKMENNSTNERYRVKWQKNSQRTPIINDNDGDGYTRHEALKLLRDWVYEWADPRYTYEDDDSIKALQSTYEGVPTSWYMGAGFYSEECEPLYLEWSDYFSDSENTATIELMTPKKKGGGERQL